MKTPLLLERIDIKHSPRVRAEIHKGTVADYAAQYLLKQHGMPPPVVFKVAGSTPTTYIIGDGLHRVTAMLRAKLKRAEFIIQDGDHSKCVRYALQANTTHGLRRSNADKQAGTETALKEFPSLSDRQLAEIAGVSSNFVSEVRRELETDKQIPHETKRIGADGKTYSQVSSDDTSTKKDEKKPANQQNQTSSPVPPGNTNASGSKADLMVDETGLCEIPHKARGMWGRRAEIQQLLTAVSRVKSEVGALYESGDPIVFELKGAAWQRLRGALEEAYTLVALCKPYAVCLNCQGKLSTCNVCGSTERNHHGLMSRFLYEGPAYAELRKLREKTAKKAP